MEDMAQQIVELYPGRFKWHPTKWSSFPDGTDNIEIGGFLPENRISGADVLMLASFHDNGVTLSQFSVMITLLTSFINSLTVVLPFYPTGTMERVTTEGQVATANTYAQLFSNLPSCGKPTRLMTYDLHTLQNRFYLHNNACASLQTAIPVLVDRLKASNPAIDCIAFPDDGAAKRFARMFTELTGDFEMVTCGKTRGEGGDKRVITIQDGSCAGKRVLIVDDLVQTGGTLLECGRALKAAGALEVSAYATHGVFPDESWRRFTRQGRDGNGDGEVDSSDGFCFERFYLTDSIPTITSMLPRDDVFEILPLSAKIVDDLDAFTKDI
jgi:phosphoribosylpyrophosphate synthetase